MDRATLLWWVVATLVLVTFAATLFYFDQRIPRASPVLG